MDKTKSKLAAFFDDGEESSFPQKPVDDMKLSQYTAGKVRKSRREKEQEAADAKRREEEVNAAQAYADFLVEFEGREGMGQRGGASFVKAESKVAYAPSVQASERRRQPTRSPSPSISVLPKPKGKRAMDAFLEEIKREQAEREAKYSRQGHGHGRSATAMAAYEGQSGSKDRGDPLTTNLFVANLPLHVTEQNLGKYFSRIGPVGSVKIMWPRTDIAPGPTPDATGPRRGKGTGLNGFVSFMNRPDAEEALREFDGFEWGGSVLRVGWSKAVPVAAKALYTSSRTRDTRSRSRNESRSRSQSRERYRARSRDGHHRSRRSRSPSRDRHHSRSRQRRSYSRSRRHYRSHSRSRSRSHRRHSRSPMHEDADAVTDTFIRAVAAEIKGHDTKYEETLREFEKNNSKYNFIFHRSHRRHAYYRGLIESEETIRPVFDDDGNNSVYSSDSEEESEREQSRKNVLGYTARQRFEAMLRALSGKRGEIARCMSFSLEHAEAAHEVADIIVSSLLVDGTAVPRKVARLHLICDILHNSAAPVPSAWKFRQEFQARLGIVFDHLANIYHSFPGRITADMFKKQITTVVDIWEDWIVFSPDFTSQLRRRLEGAKALEENLDQEEPAVQTTNKGFVSRFKSSTFQLAAEPLASTYDDGDPMDVSSEDGNKGLGVDIDGDPVDDVDEDQMKNGEGEDIDGDPIGEDVDGEPITEDVDGEPIAEDVGEPLGDDLDIDGIPVDDGIDGYLLSIIRFNKNQWICVKRQFSTQTRRRSFDEDRHWIILTAQECKTTSIGWCAYQVWQRLNQPNCHRVTQTPFYNCCYLSLTFCAKSKCFDEMKNFMVGKLDRHNTYISKYSSSSWKQTYGSFGHLRTVRRLDENIMTFGKSLHMDLCSNLHAISEVHFVAAGSGAYMTSKMLEFFDHYGTQLRPEDFDSAWGSFTSCGTKNNSHCEENEISPLIKSAIFIAPSLPSPTGVLSLLGNWTRPSIYDHMKLYAPNIQFFPVLKTHPEMDRPHLDTELENQEQVLFTSDLDILKTILEERFQPLFHNEETGPSA